jgi:hypothetical protein
MRDQRVPTVFLNKINICENITAMVAMVQQAGMIPILITTPLLGGLCSRRYPARSHHTANINFCG